MFHGRITKKSNKGSENLSGKKRAAAAAAAVVAVSLSQPLDVEDREESVHVAPGSPESPQSRKRAKHERKMVKVKADPDEVMVKIEAGDENDPTSDVEADVKTDVKAEVKVKVEAEVEAEIEAEVKVEIKAEVKVEVEAEVEAEVKTEVEAEVKTEVKVETDATVLSICPSARKLQNNIAIAIKGPPEALVTVARAETMVLVMIANDVEWTSKMNKERESAFTGLSFVPLKDTA